MSSSSNHKVILSFLTQTILVLFTQNLTTCTSYPSFYTLKENEECLLETINTVIKCSEICDVTC